MKLSSEQKQIMDWRMQAFALQGVGTHNAWLIEKQDNMCEQKSKRNRRNYE